MVLKKQKSLSGKDNHLEEKHTHRRVIERTQSSPDLELLYNNGINAANSPVRKKSASESSTPLKKAKIEAKLDRKKNLFNKLKKYVKCILVYL